MDLWLTHSQRCWRYCSCDCGINISPFWNGRSFSVGVRSIHRIRRSPFGSRCVRSPKCAIISPPKNAETNFVSLITEVQSGVQSSHQANWHQRRDVLFDNDETHDSIVSSESHWVKGATPIDWQPLTSQKLHHSKLSHPMIPCCAPVSHSCKSRLRLLDVLPQEPMNPRHLSSARFLMVSSCCGCSRHTFVQCQIFQHRSYLIRNLSPLENPSCVRATLGRNRVISAPRSSLPPPHGPITRLSVRWSGMWEHVRQLAFLASGSRFFHIQATYSW